MTGNGDIPNGAAVVGHSLECVDFGTFDVHLDEIDMLNPELIEQGAEGTSGNALARGGIEDRARRIELVIGYTHFAVTRMCGTGNHDDVTEPIEPHSLLE